MIKYMIDLFRKAFSSKERGEGLELKVVESVDECPGCRKIRTNIRDAWYFPPMSEREGYQERDIIKEVYCKRCEKVQLENGKTLQDHLGDDIN
jgi:hypothetical protein